MSRLYCRVSCLLAVLLLAQASLFAATPPADTLLPNTTKGFFSVPSLDVLRKSFEKTELGELTADPAMKPFMEDLQRQLQEKWSRTHEKLGISWEDLEGVPSGEVALAVVLHTNTETGSVVVADVTGHQQQTQALLAKIEQNMAARKAARTQANVLGTPVVIFNIPKRDEIPARQMAYFVRGDLLAVSDNLRVLEGVLARAAQPRNDSLALLPAYAAVMKRVQAASGQLAPEARWFIEPFGYADAARLMSEQPRRRGTDMLKILRTEGFTAILGAGGFVNFSAGPYEVLHRTFVFAPGNPGAGQRFTLSARMLDFPSGGNFLPPNWVPADVASYAAFNVNVKNAFEASKTLVNQVVGDEVFEDVLDSIKTDENGPQIDVRKEVIAYLGNRATIISDVQLPITPKSERLLYAVVTTNEQHLARVIQRWMETDPDTRRREIAGHVVWEIVDEKAELPMVVIENAPGQERDEEPVEEERTLPPNSAVTVAFGNLMVATHIDVLTKVLTQFQQGPKLAGSADYLRVEAELARIAPGEQFGQMFTRTDEAYRGPYELLRTGRMPESESMLGRMLNSLLGEGKEGALRPQRIDGSKMPDYDMVRRYLGPAGISGTTEADGWLFTGFLLSKQGQ